MVLTVTVAPFLKEADIRAPRPAAPPQVHHEIFQNLERFDTRLWEDPSEAITRGLRAEASSIDSGLDPNQRPPSFRSFVKSDDVARWLSDPSESRTPIVVAISMNFGAHPEHAETRRRTRFALHTAMTSAGYGPMDSQHIGAFQHGKYPGVVTTPFGRFEPSPTRTSSPSVIVTVPFERFEPLPTRAGGPPVLVLWLDEDFFIDTVRTDGHDASGGGVEFLLPLQRLRNELRINQITLIGPTTSDLLSEMLRSLGRTSSENRSDNGIERNWSKNSNYTTWLRIYSPSATAPPMDLAQAYNNAFEQRQPPSGERSLCEGATTSRKSATRCIQDVFRTAGIEFRSMVPDDGRLLDAVKRELAFRWCGQERPSKPRILLIGETDTFYARALLGNARPSDPDGDEVELCRRYRMDAKFFAATRPIPDFWQYRKYTFLRDLNDPYIDDDVAVRNKLADRAKSKTESNVPQATIGEAVSEGDPQFDYVRRMAKQMLDDQANEKGGAGGVFAIGILGGDDYDKLTWLRALRPKFQKALFFTTDLDARLWDAPNIDTARNLLVASGFGLKPGEHALKAEGQPEETAGLPVFRRDAQTAYFHALRAALSMGSPGDEFDRFSNGSTVNVYELGLSQPYLMSFDRKATDKASAEPKLSQQRADKGEPSDSGKFRKLKPLVLLVATAFAVSYLLRRLCLTAVRFCLAGLRPTTPRGVSRFRFAFVTTVALAILAVWWRWGAFAWVIVAVVLPWFCIGWGQKAPGTTPPPSPQYRWWRLGLGMLALGILAWFFWLGYQACLEARAGTGEPLALMDGVSIWVGSAIRWLAIAAGIVWLFTIFGTLAKNTEECAAEVAERMTAETPPLRVLLRFRACTANRVQFVNSDDSFHSYADVSHWVPMLIVGAVVTYILYLATAGLYMVFESPNNPARGYAAVTFYYQTLVAGGVALFALIATLAYAVLTCRAWILRSVDERHSLPWHQDTEDRAREKYSLPRLAFRVPRPTVSAKFMAAERTLLGARHHMELIAMRTRVLTPLVYAPFLIITILLFARWDRFDYTIETTSVVVMFTVSTLFSIGIVAALRSAAKKFKKHLLEDMDKALHDIRRADTTYNAIRKHLARLSAIRAEAEAETSGAFQPILEQPIVKAILVIVGGAGFQQIADLLQWFK
ncbi:MAG: hypothetical protein K2Y35_01515 [Burkholderiales bacterium]|nr:hypothetical protein [Burkholderiales bacterium]